MGSDSNAKTTPANSTAPSHSHMLDGGEAAAGSMDLFPEITLLQRTMGNRAVSRGTELLSRQLLHTSNRANTIQRIWPFSDAKTMPIDDASATVGQLNFDMDLADSMWKIENTSTAGGKALEALLEIDTKLKALKQTVSKGKYKGADAAKKEDVMGRIDAAIAKVARLISSTREAIAALKLQEAKGASSVRSFTPTGPDRPPIGPDKLLEGIRTTGTTGAAVGGTAMSVESGARSGQLLGAQNRQAMYENATGGQLETNKVQTTGAGGVRGFMDDMAQFVRNIKEAIFNISWVKKIVDFLEPFKNWSFLLSIIYDAYNLYDAYDRYTALKAGAEEATATGATDSVAKSMQYGFAKVKRALYSNIAKFGLSLSKTIARVITLLTGGATALVTESIALAADLGTAIMSVGRKAKGLYKTIRGTRGKNRRENAKELYDHAMRGDKRALKLMIALKPFGLLATVKNKTYINNIPDSPDEMLTWMHANATDRKSVIKSLADKLKSL